MKSQTPTWAIVMAILMMLIGGCGIKNDVQFINIRSILDMKDKILENIADENANSEPDSLIEEEIEVDSEKSDSSSAFEALKEPYIEDDDTKASDTVSTFNNKSDSDKKSVNDTFGTMDDIPEKTIKKIIAFGYIGLFFSFLFLLGGLFLLI
jgi:murein L,D-transpeptidase YafK